MEDWPSTTKTLKPHETTKNPRTSSLRCLHQLLQVLSSHPLGSGNGGFNPKICDHFYRENDDEPWKHLLFSYHFQVPNPPLPLRHFAPSPSAPVPSAAPSQLTHPVGSLERPARSTLAVSAAALNYLPLVRADHSTAKALQLEVGFGRPLTIY